MNSKPRRLSKLEQRLLADLKPKLDAALTPFVGKKANKVTLGRIKVAASDTLQRLIGQPVTRMDTHGH